MRLADLTRRTVLAAGAAACASVREDEPYFAAIEASLQGGRLGVFAFRTGERAGVGRRADERFAMASTFKAALVGAVLRKIDEGALALEDETSFADADLLDHAPVAQAHLAEGRMSLETMCEGAVTLSDNTCANLLLRKVGGPAGLTAFLRGLGDKVTRLDRNELALNENAPGDPRDTTSPRAMAHTIDTLVFGEALSPPLRTKLRDWMIDGKTGAARIWAGVGAGWIVGDKTGTGERGATGDVGFLFPPGAYPPVLIAVYTDAPNATPAAREAAIAACARLVAGRFAN